MNGSLAASSDRLKIGSMLRKMMPWDKSAEKVQQDRLYMGQVAQELVKNRRDHPTEKRDLLNAMIKGKDPKTGDFMSDGLISANMITFLIAGHETTSGLLSFAMLNLLKNPETYFKAQQEVDEVLGRGKMTVEHLKDLKYINAVLRETLRLHPTAPAFSRSIRNDNPNDVEELLGGKYAIRRDDKVLCLIAKSQRDPKVYGDDANKFNPERMLEDNFQRLPKGAWKPFGTGVRACIGRAFAWQEAQMALALILQSEYRIFPCLRHMLTLSLIIFRFQFHTRRSELRAESQTDSDYQAGRLLHESYSERWPDCNKSTEPPHEFP
jgi:cytochrome P450/NADPH-cytochrome P450 reductase